MTINKKGHKIFKLSIIICFFLFVFSYLMHNSFTYLDHDLGWHLKVGEEIVKNGAVPEFEKYNYTLEGRSWVDHEWASNALIYLIFNKLNYIYLSMFFALVVIILLVLQMLFVRKYYKDSFVFLACAQYFGLLAMAPHLGVRVQEFSLVFLFIIIMVLNHFSKFQNWKYLLVLLPVFAIWANLHPGFLIGLFILCLYWAVKILELMIGKRQPFSFIRFNFNDPVGKKSLAILAVFIFFSFCSTLITPYGYKLFLFLTKFQNDYYLKAISEWLPFYSYPVQYKQLVYSALVACALIISLFFNVKRDQNRLSLKINLWHLSLSVLFLYLSMKSKRHFPLLFVASLPFLLDFYTRNFARDFKRFSWLKSSRIIRFYLFAAMLLVASDKLLHANFAKDPFNNRLFCREFPCKAVSFIKDQDQYSSYRIFNNYDWGGYSIWMWPDKQLFIDGRMPMYEFNGHTLLEEYHEFFHKNADYAGKLNEYGIEMVMLRNYPPPKFKKWEMLLFGIKDKDTKKRDDHLKNYLLTAKNWKLIYNDNISDIFVKQ